MIVVDEEKVTMQGDEQTLLAEMALASLYMAKCFDVKPKQLLTNISSIVGNDVLPDAFNACIEVTK